MTDLPTLIVDAGAFPDLTVRIDGDLPMVFDVKQDHSYEWRPLRASDRVTLAYHDNIGVHCDEVDIPFATATVAGIDGPAWDGLPGEFHYFVTVADVEALT